MTFLLLAALLADCPLTDPSGKVPPPGGNYKSGKVEPGWCMAGIDLPGFAGPDAPVPMEIVTHYTETSVSVERLQREPFAPPPTWQRMGQAPLAGPAFGDFTDMLVQFHGKRVVMVTANPAWRVGKAICTIELGPTTVYLVGSAEPDAEDKEAIESELSEAMRRPPPSTVCFGAVAAADGYRYRFHSPSGAAADEVDKSYADTLIEIVPAGDPETRRPPPID